MSEKKIATPEHAKAIWDSLPKPSCRLVWEALNEQGFATPGPREIGKWKLKGGWPKPKQPKKVDPRNLVHEQTQPAAVVKRVTKPKHSNEAMAKGFQATLEKKLDEEPTLVAVIKQALKDHDKEWEEAGSDENRMSMVSMNAMKSASRMFVALGYVGPELVGVAPEAVGKCYQSISAGLVTATNPIEQIIATRSITMKTVVQPNGKVAEVITAEEFDPVAESFKAAFLNGARA